MSKVLTILSRDCIENTENYKVVIEYVDTESGSKVGLFIVSFRTNIHIDLRKQISSKSIDSYIFIITITEDTSGVIVDSMNSTIDCPQGKY